MKDMPEQGQPATPSQPAQPGRVEGARGGQGPEPELELEQPFWLGDTLVGCGKYVMISYCWDEQPVIKRVSVALVGRGYRVCSEYGAGMSEHSMSDAVENAEVMLIGMSRQYKGNTECRMEAQFAMQREVCSRTGIRRMDGWGC